MATLWAPLKPSPGALTPSAPSSSPRKALWSLPHALVQLSGLVFPWGGFCVCELPRPPSSSVDTEGGQRGQTLLAATACPAPCGCSSLVSRNAQCVQLLWVEAGAAGAHRGRWYRWHQSLGTGRAAPAGCLQLLTQEPSPSVQVMQEMLISPEGIGVGLCLAGAAQSSPLCHRHLL